MSSLSKRSSPTRIHAAERADSGKILDSEADSFRRTGEATIIERLARATLAFSILASQRCHDFFPSSYYATQF
jgi:hypothetical protein